MKKTIIICAFALLVIAINGFYFEYCFSRPFPCPLTLGFFLVLLDIFTVGKLLNLLKTNLKK